MSNEIKIGDKLFSKIESDNFNKNTFYNVFEIDKSSEEIFGFNMNIIRHVKMCDNKSCYCFSFCLNDDTRDNYIWNYFYKPIELRLEKLKNLKNFL